MTHPYTLAYREEPKMIKYLTWLKARIADAETSGELWMIDPLSIRRAWESKEARPHIPGMM